MRVDVDRKLCDNHGQCAIVAPAVFQMDDNSELVFDAHPADSYLDEVDEAADVCPMQAIFIGED